MIFDLKTGKRRRVVQVVFGFLAFIFFISFVGFGVGSDVTGGIFDALGIGGGSSSSDPQYEQQIEDAQSAVDQNPKDGSAYGDLIAALLRLRPAGDLARFADRPALDQRRRADRSRARRSGLG